MILAIMLTASWHRLGWVLIHFLWQGTLIGAVAWAALAPLKRLAAQTRYVVLCAALAACGSAPCATWIVLAPTKYPAPLSADISLPVKTASAAPEPSPSRTLSSAVAAPATAAPSSSHFSPAGTVNQALPYIVVAWAIGVLVLSLRLLHGWTGLRQLRSTGLPVRAGDWDAKLRPLAQKMGIRRTIKILESAWVEVPTLIGWLKPVVLIPTSFVTCLPPAQVEAILAHELAHICRQDYLVNLAQLVIETILFYHPAVWWLGRAIRRERENCCDDLAVRITGNRLVYAQALAALEECRHNTPALALAATGGTLLDRIRRLLLREHGRASQAAFGPAIIVGLVLTLCVLSLRLRAEPSPFLGDDPFGNLNLSKLTLDEAGWYAIAFRNAVMQDKLGLVEAFLKHGMQVNPSVFGDILSDAAYFTHDPQMVKLLLAHGARPLTEDPSTVDRSLRDGNKQVVDLLIAAGGTCNPLSYDAALGEIDDLEKRFTASVISPGESAKLLDLAVDGGQVATFDFLWTKPRSGNAEDDAKELGHFYNRAAADGHLPLLMRLEQMGVKPPDGGAEALGEAVAGNHMPEAKHLLNNGVKLPPDPEKGRGLLGESSGRGRLEMVRLLLDHGANINAQDFERWTPLCGAGYEGQDDVCQLLVQRGADLTIQDKYKRTAVWYAAGGTHCVGALALMVQKGVRIDGLDTNGSNLLQAAFNFIPPEPGKFGFPGAVLSPADQLAYEAREERTIDLLITAGLDPSGQAGTQTPLMTVLNPNHYPAAHALLRHHADIHVQDAQGDTAIAVLFNTCRARFFPFDVLDGFLAQGLDVNESLPIANLTPKTYTTVLEKAVGSLRSVDPQVITDHQEVVRRLLQHGGKFPGLKSEAEQDALLAAAQGDLPRLQQALAHGASPDTRETFGYSPLLISIRLGYFDNAHWLLEHGANPATSRTIWGDSPLAAAVAANRADLVKLLIAKGDHPAQGSGLSWAVENGNQEIFDVLLAAGADPHEANLFGCIQHGRVEMARVLLERGVDPQPPPFNENRANVYWAVYYNQSEILQMLLDHGADPTMVDAYGATPLSEAKQSHAKMVPMIEAAIKRRQAPGKGA